MGRNTDIEAELAAMKAELGLALSFVDQTLNRVEELNHENARYREALEYVCDIGNRATVGFVRTVIRLDGDCWEGAGKSPFRVGCGTVPDDAPEDLSQTPQITVSTYGGWISVDERLPKCGGEYFGTNGKTVDTVVFSSCAKDGFACWVTHWQPIQIPAPPREM